MALGADLHPDLFLGGAGDELVAAGATHGGLHKFGMDSGFHGLISIPDLTNNLF
jgi:hypothetical protein